MLEDGGKDDVLSHLIVYQVDAVCELMRDLLVRL